MPINRKGKPCTARIRTEMGTSGDFIEPGTPGRILATRTKERHALVEWGVRPKRIGDHPLADLLW